MKRLLSCSVPSPAYLGTFTPWSFSYLQHRILLFPPGKSKTESHFCFGWATSFFLELLVIALLTSSILDTFWPGELIIWCHIFLPFYTVHGILTARVLEWFAFPLPVDHVLSELSTMACLSWVALRGMAHSFIELCKSLCHDKAVIHEGTLRAL